jgi:hypothetical protein
MCQASSFFFRWIIRNNLVAVFCVSGAVMFATPMPTLAAAKAIDHTSCKAAKPIKGLVGTAYMFILRTSSGKHELGLVSCSAVGAPAKGHRFTLYDLNGGALQSGDQVAIRGPHGRLLGVPSVGKVSANRIRVGKPETFTIHRVGETVSTKGSKTTTTYSLLDRTTVKENFLIALKTKNGRFLSAENKGGGKVVGKKTLGAAEVFTVKRLTNAAIKGGVGSIADLVAKTLMEKILGRKENATEENQAHIHPAECRKELSKEEVPEEVEKAEAARNKSKNEKEKKSQGKSILMSLFDVISGPRACGKVSIAITYPGSGLGIEAFYTREKPTVLPVWHIAMLADSNTLRTLGIEKLIPELKTLIGVPKVKSLVVVISEDQGVKNLSELNTTVGSYLKEFEKNIKVPTIFGTKKHLLGSVQLEQGVNLFVEFENPTKGALATVSKRMFPGIEKSKETWRISGVVGSKLFRKMLNMTSSIKGSDADEFDKKKAFHLQVWTPGFTPYPFPALKRKDAFHMELEKAMFRVDLSKSKKGGTVSGSIEVEANSFADYWLLGKHFPVTSQGTLSFTGNVVKGKLQGVYTPKKGEDPLGFLPGFHVSKLMFGGGAGLEMMEADKKTNTKESQKGTMMFTVGSQIGIDGYKDVATAFRIAIAKQGSKFKLEGISLALQGEGDEGKLKLSTLPLLKKIPFINEWTLEKAVVGIQPKKGGPDYYLTGGGTWARNNIGGKAAIVKKKLKGREEMFLFMRANDFNFTDLMSKKMDKTVRGALASLKTPRVMFILSTAKGTAKATARDDVGTLKMTDLPPELVPMFDEIVSEANDVVPIYGGGVTLIAALDFNEAEDKLIKSAV